jgi:hypothetical protein
VFEIVFKMKYLFYFICFLIISCDLPSEADQDCNGDEHGLALIDRCGFCSGGNTDLYPCEEDCTGEFGGFAQLDECGVCDGNSLSCSDCAGVSNGDADYDECNVCGGEGACDCGDGSSTCICCCDIGEILDCNGDCGGSAIIDDCGGCAGVEFLGTSPGDRCDCLNSTLEIDGCGVCDGDGYIDCMCNPISGYDFTYLDHDDSFNCISYEANVSGSIV